MDNKEFPEILTIDQLAQYLQLHRQVIYRHVRQGNIPASRIGGTIRFKKSVIDAWLEDSALQTIEGKKNQTRTPHSPFNLEED